MCRKCETWTDKAIGAEPPERCEVCEALQPDEVLYTDEHGNRICTDCAEANDLWQCENCGCWTTDDLPFCHDCGGLPVGRDWLEAYA